SFVVGGTVPPEAVAAFERALALAPQEPRARYYLGLAARQAGRREEAMTRWLALESESPPDAPWRNAVAERIAALAAEMGLDEAELAKRRAAAAEEALPPARGPEAAEVEAAQSMSADERAGMIRGMVEGLAARLEKEPGDADGWTRLARS